MKIVFLITALDYSGGPKMMAWVANQFAKAGHEVTFISVYSDIIGQPLEKNVSFISLHQTKSTSRIIRNTTEMLRIQRYTKKQIDKINPDLVIGFLYSVDYFYTLLNRNKKRKIILSQRLDPYTESGISGKLKKHIIAKADGVVFQSYGARDFYDSKTKKKAVVIPNPVTGKTLAYKKDVLPFAEREDVIVLPARLDIPQKRQDVMIDAFEIVVKAHPDVKLVLLGNGPDREKLENIISEKQLEDKIIVHEAVASAEEYTKKCKILCLTSDFEGLPNSLIEGMALGLCVVATDCSPGGARMLIEDGVNGFIVPKGDYKALAERICEILEHPEYSAQMEEKASEIAEKYSESRIADLWISYAETIVG